MRRDELLEKDLLSELLLAASGVVIFAGLVLILLAAVASTALLK